MLHNDDTGVKILEMMGERARQAALDEERTDDRAEDSVEDAAEGPREDSEEGSTKKQKADRTGMFTTGIVSTREGHKMALFPSRREHAGENLKDVLTRARQSCLRRFRCVNSSSCVTVPAELKTILANCLAHARRQFVEVVHRFPEKMPARAGSSLRDLP